MFLLEKHPDGYSLRRTDTPATVQPLIVAEDELAETVAALFADDELGDFAAAWDQMAQAAQTYAQAA